MRENLKDIKFAKSKGIKENLINRLQIDEVKLKIEKALARAVTEGINGTHQLSQIVRKTIGEWVGTTHRRRPMIVPVVIEV